MSFILDALRKAAREKQRDSALSMDDVMHAPPDLTSAPPARRSWMLSMLMTALVLGLVWLLVSRGNDGTSSGSPVTTDRVQSTDDTADLKPDGGGRDPVAAEKSELAVAAVKPAIQQLKLTETLSAPPDLGPNSDPDVPDVSAHQPLTRVLREDQLEASSERSALVTAQTEPQDEAPDDETIRAESFDDLLDRPDQKVIKAAPENKGQNASKVRATVAQKSVATAPSEKPLNEKPPLPVTLAKETESKALAIPGKESAEPTSIRDMPDAYRAGFPAFRVDVHVHNAEPEHRWIMVNGKKYVEGANLAEGPSVEEITENSVIYRFKNELVTVPLSR